MKVNKKVLETLISVFKKGAHAETVSRMVHGRHLGETTLLIAMSAAWQKFFITDGCWCLHIMHKLQKPLAIRKNRYIRIEVSTFMYLEKLLSKVKGDYVSVAELRKHKYELGLLEDDEVFESTSRMTEDTFDRLMIFGYDKKNKDKEFMRGSQMFSCKYMSFIMDVMQGLGVDHYTHQTIYDEKALQFCGKTEEDDDHCYDYSFRKSDKPRRNVFWVSFLLKEVNRIEVYKHRFQKVFQELHKGIKY